MDRDLRATGHVHVQYKLSLSLLFLSYSFNPTAAFTTISLPAICISVFSCTIPAGVSTASYPLPLEFKHFYYRIPSHTRLIARSGPDVWLQPTGPEAYFLPRESSPIGLHPL